MGAHLQRKQNKKAKAAKADIALRAEQISNAKVKISICLGIFIVLELFTAVNLLLQLMGDNTVICAMVTGLVGVAPLLMCSSAWNDIKQYRKKTAEDREVIERNS